MNEPELTPQEERLTRYLDGQLDEAARAELEREIGAEPAERQRQAAEDLRRLLRAQVEDADVPYPDFFNSHLLKKIREEQAAGATGRRRGLVPLFGWLRSPWAAAAAAAAVLAVVGLVQTGSAGEHTRTLLVYSPEPQAVTDSYYSKDAGAMIVDVRGLPELPDDRRIVGNNGSDTAGLVATLAP